MYYFGFVGLGLIVYILKSAELTDFQVIALVVGTLFANITGWLHNQRQISETKYVYLISKQYAAASSTYDYSNYIERFLDWGGGRVLVRPFNTPELVVKSKEIPEEKFKIEVIRFRSFDSAVRFAQSEERLSILRRHGLKHASWVVDGEG